MGYGNNTYFGTLLGHIGPGLQERVVEKGRTHNVYCYTCKQKIETGEHYVKDEKLIDGYNHTYCLEHGMEIAEMRGGVEKLWNDPFIPDDQVPF